MKRSRVLLLVVGGVAVLLTAQAIHSSRTSAPSASGAGASRGSGADAPLRAVGVVVEATVLRESARTVGTLTANEAVDIVAELSRRLVRVHVEEGAVVDKGALLFELDDAALRAELAELEARRTLAASTVERQRRLAERERKALSAQALDEGRADLQAIEAQIQAVKVTIAKTAVRAPFAGRVGIRRVSEGAWVTPETMLTTLQDTSRIKVDFMLPERYAPAIRAGLPFTFRVAGRAQAFEGVVTAIEPRIDAATRSLVVRGEIANDDGLLIPGSFATVDVPLEATSGGVSIPSEALLPSMTGHGVYVLKDGRAELRPVEIGIRTSTEVQVLSGLEPGETVLASNLLRLAPGVAVELAAAEATPE